MFRSYKIIIRDSSLLSCFYLIIKMLNNPSGIYKLKCNTCNKVYVGQSGRAIGTRFKEHIRYVRSNNSTSAYIDIDIFVNCNWVVTQTIHRTKQNNNTYNNTTILEECGPCPVLASITAHILENRHEYGPKEETLQLLKPCRKGKHVD